MLTTSLLKRSIALTSLILMTAEAACVGHDPRRDRNNAAADEPCPPDGACQEPPIAPP